jgi:DNA-binding CsgD family transcriptional regulator
MIVNLFGNVVHANPVVVRLAGNGLSIQNRRAIAATLDGQKSLDALIRKTIWPTTEAPQQAPVALPRGPGRKPLLVQAIPLRAEQSAASGLLRANVGALVLVVDPETAGARTETETFRLLGLTATEAKIASILGTGSSPEAAADMLGLSVGTVRNHIKRVFSKLDISRQGQLVDLAGRLSVMTTGRH